MHYYRHFSQSFPQEDLKVYEYFETGEYYFETGSKLSLVFLYFKVKDLGEKAYFKVPMDWEKVGAREREDALRVRFFKKGVSSLIKEGPLITM
jgi:hypothetical protein